MKQKTVSSFMTSYEHNMFEMVTRNNVFHSFLFTEHLFM
jgi:hypothetical protein